MKKIFCLLPLCLAACLFAAGCGAAGIGSKGILRAIYLERQGGGYQVQLICYQGAPSADAAEAEQTTLLVEGRGGTVYEALQNAQQSRSEELFFGQNELLLIGPRLAGEGLFEAVEYLVRQDAGRPNITVYLTDLAADDLAAQPEAAEGLLSSLEQLRSQGGFRCYLYQLSGQAQNGLLPNLRVDLAEGAAAEDGLTVYAGGLPAHRWGQNELQLARLLTGQGKLLCFTADLSDFDGLANVPDLEEGTISFTLRSADAAYTPFWQEGALMLDALVQGEICRVETEEGAQSPLRDKQFEPCLRAWLANLARRMTDETFAEGNDLFHLGSRLEGLDAAAAARQAAAGGLYQTQNVRWHCDARVQ